jgi:hypothetical protein
MTTSHDKGNDRIPITKKEKLPVRGENPKVTTQVRKVLGKHYSNKYRTGRHGG